MDVAQLSVRELKAECVRYGVSTDSCTEKSDLVALVSRLRAAGPPSQPSSSKASARKPAAAAVPAEPSEKDGPGWEDVRRVLRCSATDYYAILGVTESADDKVLKKAYLLLALKLHPDKCRAARADEAFKRVGAAFATLSDPRKRMAFDAAGGAAGAAAAERRGHGGGFGGGGFGARGGGMHGGFGDQDAEELFRAFFGSDGPAGASWSWGGEKAVVSTSVAVRASRTGSVGCSQARCR